jgi:hypothetical protein
LVGLDFFGICCNLTIRETEVKEVNMPQVIEACDVKVGDLIGSDECRTLEVTDITSHGKFLSFDFEGGEPSWKEITSRDKILLLCRPAV